MKQALIPRTRIAILAAIAVLGIVGCGDRLLPPDDSVSPLPAGTRIVFTERDASEPSKLRVISIRPDGSDRRVIADPGYLSSPPAHGLIAYETSSKYGAVRVSKVDGSDARTIYLGADSASAIVTGVALSPSGRQVAFATRDGLLHLVDTDGGNRVTFGSELDTNFALFTPKGTPAFSPDGKRIVYALVNPDPSRDYASTYMADIASKSLVHDSTFWNSIWNGFDSIFVSFSPDGSRYGFAMSWSPDGSRYAIAPVIGDNHADLMIMNSIGAERPTLYVTPATPQMEFGPQWSPDGSRVLFLSWPMPVVFGFRAGTILMYDVTTGRIATVDSSGLAINAFWSMGE